MCRRGEACAASLAEVGPFGVVSPAVGAAVCHFLGFAARAFFGFGFFALYLFVARGLQTFFCGMAVTEEHFELGFYFGMAFASVRVVYGPTEAGKDLFLFFGEFFQLGLGIKDFHIGVVLRHEAGQSFY